MDDFKAIYRILSALKKAMDYPEFDVSQISAEKLGVSKERWARYIEMLADSGYIKGVCIETDLSGETDVECDYIRITLNGLEYLQENSLMRKAYKAAKGIKEVTPFV